jgi:hypothetical protein
VAETINPERIITAKRITTLNGIHLLFAKKENKGVAIEKITVK